MDWGLTRASGSAFQWILLSLQKERWTRRKPLRFSRYCLDIYVIFVFRDGAVFSISSRINADIGFNGTISRLQDGK